eukprot:scaffold198517_cov25-Prasinocladus_malaysianus.AAC.1
MDDVQEVVAQRGSKATHERSVDEEAEGARAPGHDVVEAAERPELEEAVEFEIMLMLMVARHPT